VTIHLLGMSLQGYNPKPGGAISNAGLETASPPVRSDMGNQVNSYADGQKKIHELPIIRIDDWVPSGC
jgi:hypothetical protein